MDLEGSLSFLAHGTAYRNDVSVPVAIKGSYSRWEPHPVQCIVLPDMDGLSGGFDNLFDRQGTLQLTGRTESGREIRIPKFLVTVDKRAGDQISWEGIAELFIEGDLEEFDASGGSIVCSAFVSPTPLAIPHGGYIPSYDGTITYTGDERKGIQWSTLLGKAELIDGYDYEHERAGLDQALIRVQRCQVIVKSESPGTVSLGSIVSNLQDALDEPLWLLSFLSRRRIAWYEASIVFLPSKDEPHQRLQATVRREQWLGYESERQRELSWINLLVKREALVGQLFEQLYANYTLSQFKGVIRQMIPYVLAAHETGYTETRLGLLYSALEALVSGLSDLDRNTGGILERSSFSKLAEKLSEVIRQEIQEEGAAKTIIKKLSTLNQRSYADRLLRLIENYSIDLTKLWPSGADIPSEVRALIRRRNAYIHQGKIDDHDLHILDLYRVQNLVELWILKLLDYPDTAINYLAVNVPIPLNRQ